MVSTAGKYGHNTEYRMLHLWVEKQLGKPRLCVECSTTESKLFDWANISGEYRKDISDWRRLCRQCHLRSDRLKKFKNKCKMGHELTPDNIYRSPNGDRHCLKCKRIKRKEQYQQFKKNKDSTHDTDQQEEK